MASPPSPLPHQGVHVRLGVSKIEGIGVFAIRPIAEGTDLFANDEVEIVWVERATIDALDLAPAERDFYDAFGIAREGMIGCPVNFNNLTPGWYLNEPAEGEAPNVAVDTQMRFTAARDIEEGEELTVRYAQFSDPEPRAPGAGF
jgi:hypothetical protein